MNKDQLLETARRLKHVSPGTAEEYRQKSDELIYRINQRMLDNPEIKNLVGEDNIDMMKDNHTNHVRFIASILENYNPGVFVDTVLWVFRTYRSHGFTTDYWRGQLNAWLEVLKMVLTPGGFNEIYPYYNWIQVNLPVFVKLSDQELEAFGAFH